MTTFNWKPFVKITCDIQVGDEVVIDGYGRPFVEGKRYPVVGIQLTPGTQSSVSIKVEPLDAWLDVGWVKSVHNKVGLNLKIQL